VNKHLDSNKYRPLTDNELADRTLSSDRASETEALPIYPLADAEDPDAAATRPFRRKPDALWRYDAADGALMFCVCRWDDPAGKKILPLSWFADGGWQFKQWPDARPLFNLPSITSKPDALIVVVEGEKSADAAARIFPASVATTNAGGANAAAKPDWTPLARRRVLIWPDADGPGDKYAREVASILAGLGCQVHIVHAEALGKINPDGGERPVKKGWDAADAIAEGWDIEALRKTAAVDLAKPFEPADQATAKLTWLTDLPGRIDASMTEHRAAQAAIEGPQPLRRETPPADPFPIDALGEILGGATRAIIDKLQCPDAIAACSVLAAASLAVQAHADVVLPAPGQAKPLSLFFASVAASGERKSAADEEALRPIRKHEARLRDERKAALVEYKIAKRAYDVAVAAAEKRGKGDRHEIKAAIAAVGDEPEEPIGEMLTCDDPTLEGLHKAFALGQPAQGLFSAEGGGFIAGSAMSLDNRTKTSAIPSFPS
jgi:5S rRNA maturation endonuclease (ribonuclease M5)